MNNLPNIIEVMHMNCAFKNFTNEKLSIAIKQLKWQIEDLHGKENVIFLKGVSENDLTDQKYGVPYRVNEISKKTNDGEYVNGFVVIVSYILKNNVNINGEK